MAAILVPVPFCAAASAPKATDEQPMVGDEATIWYLAEGYTGGDFDTYVLVQNPGEVDAQVTLDFQLPPGMGAPAYNMSVPAGTRRTVHLDELPGLDNTDVSTRVVATAPVVAERAMYFEYYGKIGGHDSIGVKYPGSVWYLAEGYTAAEFDTYVLVQNPGSAPTQVTLDFQLPPGTNAPSYTFDLPANTRRTVHLDELPGLAATDVSTKVSSPLPVVAERAMYFNYYGREGGHDSVGVEAPATSWYLAEGYTGGEFDTYVLVQNPGTENAKVTLNFQLPPGSSAQSYFMDVPAGTRRTVHLDELPSLAATEVSTTVSSDKAVVAERAEYFNYYGKTDGHDSAGVSQPDSDWYLAEGYTSDEFDTYVLVQNPGKVDKDVILHFQLPPGHSADPYKFNLPAGTRRTVHLDELPGLGSTDVSTWVEASGPVVAERSMYFLYYGKKGGSCSTGAVYRPPVIPATTKVLSSADLSHLTKTEDVGGRRVLTFDSETENLKNVNQGDVIMCGPTAQALNGFMLKVDTISRTGGNLVFNCVGASLEQAIFRGRLSLSNENAMKTAGGRAASSLVDLSKTFTVNQRVGTGSNYVDFSGSATLGFSIDFSIDIDFTWPDIDYHWHTKWGIRYVTLDVTPPSVSLNSTSFGASFEERIAIDATVHGDFSVSYLDDLPGLDYDFSPITFAIGPVPVVLVPSIGLVMGVDGSLHAQVSAGITQSATVSAGCAYNRSTGWSTSKGNTFTYEIRPPSPSGSFAQSDCKFSLGPQLGIKLYGIVGPYVNILPGFRVTLDSNQAHPDNPLWKIYVALDVDVGVKVEVEVGLFDWEWSLSIMDQSWRVLAWSMLLAESVRLYSITPNREAVGKEVTLSGDGFGSSRENGSYVSFGGTNATAYGSWGAQQIRCTVPQGISGTVDVTATHIFHDWTLGPVHVTIEQKSNAQPFEVATTPGGRELLTNGDFSNGLADWTIWDQGGSYAHGTNRVEVQSGPVLFMYRRCPENDGGASGVIQTLNAGLSGLGELKMTARIKASYQKGGAIAGSDPRWFPEGAVQFRIKYRKADGSDGEWYHGFYYGDVPGADTAHFTQVGQDSWYDFSSGNILSEIGAGSTITEFRVYGFGWEFDGYASSVSLSAI